MRRPASAQAEPGDSQVLCMPMRRPVSAQAEPGDTQVLSQEAATAGDSLPGSALPVSAPRGARGSFASTALASRKRRRLNVKGDAGVDVATDSVGVESDGLLLFLILHNGAVNGKRAPHRAMSRA